MSLDTSSGITFAKELTKKVAKGFAKFCSCKKVLVYNVILMH